MQKTLSLRVRPNVAAQPRELRRHLVGELGLDARAQIEWRIRRRSIDARQRTVYVNLTLDLYINEPAPGRSLNRWYIPTSAQRRRWWW